MVAHLSGRAWFPWVLGVAAAAVAIVAGQLLGTAASPVPAHPGASPAAAAPAPASSAPPAPYVLLTHCGIDEARIGDTYYEADHPLLVDYGPPAGWDNPEQTGTMTLLSSSRAVFRDDAGHTVYFHARPGATTFKQLCD